MDSQIDSKLASQLAAQELWIWGSVASAALPRDTGCAFLYGLPGAAAGTAAGTAAAAAAAGAAAAGAAAAGAAATAWVVFVCLCVASAASRQYSLLQQLFYELCLPIRGLQ